MAWGLRMLYTGQVVCWLCTQGVLCWLCTQGGLCWLCTQGGLCWLCTQGRLCWLCTQGRFHRACCAGQVSQGMLCGAGFTGHVVQGRFHRKCNAVQTQQRTLSHWPVTMFSFLSRYSTPRNRNTLGWSNFRSTDTWKQRACSETPKQASGAGSYKTTLKQQLNDEKWDGELMIVMPTFFQALDITHPKMISGSALHLIFHRLTVV